MGRKLKRKVQLYTRVGMTVLVVGIVFILVLKVAERREYTSEYREITGAEADAGKPEMDVQLLTENEYSRPGIKTNKINGIVIHYTANPGTTAQQNRDYFEGLKNNHQTKASSHFIVGLDGEIVQCVPTWEVAYASNSRNSDTVSIETCHLAEDGKYTEATYRSMVQLTAWLCKKFELTEKDVIRHYDITEKICPKYFVDNEEAWEAFRNEVGDVLNKM